MSCPTFFFKPCPTCGRRLEIKVEHFGKLVECPSCTSRFVAGETPDSDERTAALEQALLKADEYLAQFIERPSSRVFSEEPTTVASADR